MKTIIDIGTNTILMLIAEFDYNTSQIKTILDLLQHPRIGKGVDSNRSILRESINKAVSVINEYRSISYDYGSKDIIATATSFLRDARNKSDFITEIKDKTGIDVEILSGEDEARWTFWGGVYGKFRVHNPKSKPGVIDIGGGSTEVITCENIPDGQIDRDVLFNLPMKAISIDVGSVRVKEKFLIENPPSANCIKEAVNNINKQFDGLHINSSYVQLTGVAGTVTTLGAIKLGLKKFEKDKIDKLDLTLAEIEDIFNRLSVLKLEEIEQVGEYMEGRADIILAGILILKTFMKKFDIDRITVSTKGLRFGIFLREVLK